MTQKHPFSGLVMALMPAILSPPAGLSAAAIRSELEKTPGGLMIRVTPPPETAVYAVEERVPAGAFPRRISHEGVYDPHTGKVKWGPFYDDQPRDLTFEISTEGENVVLVGAMSHDDNGPIPTTGIEELDLPHFESYFAGWQHRLLPVNTPLYSGDTILPGASLPLIVQYAMGQEPGEFGSPFQMVLLDGGERILRYTRDLRRADISLELQSSVDLIEWTVWEPLFEEIEPLDQDTEIVQVPDLDNAPFYRISVTKEEPGP